MTAVSLSGTSLAAEIRTDVAARAAALEAAGHRPTFAVVTATDDELSAWYVQSIVRAADKVGIGCEVTDLGASATEHAIRAAVRELDGSPRIAGVIVQTPLPTGVALADVAVEIAPGKDIDGANPLSLGRLVCGRRAFAPATAEAVVRLLDHHGIALRGREVVVVGRSVVVGKPLAHLLLDRDATVTVAHSRTAELARVASRADVVVAAAGRAGLVTADHVGAGAVVVDVGTNVTADGALVGDVDPAVADVAGALSPVPGGVGPVTTAVLLLHAVEAAEVLSTTVAGADGRPTLPHDEEASTR